MTQYDHIVIEELVPGVYGAMASPAGAAGSNSGIVNLGDETIVFDTTATLGAARELFAAAKELTGRAPGYVINSHSHPDHIHGNAIFNETSVIISSAVTRDEIVRDGIQSMANMHHDLTTQISLFLEQLDGCMNESERLEIEDAIQFFERILEGYPTPDDLRVPNVTYDHQLDFHGSERSARLLTFGGAHSACDAVLWLPESGILFAGDVIGEPVLCLGYPGNWWSILDNLASLGAKRIVPGHGDVWLAYKGFEMTRNHLNRMFMFSEQAIHTDDPFGYVETVEIPAGQSEYWFRKDLRFLVEQRIDGRL